MAIGDTCIFWLSHTSPNTTFFPKPPANFLTCFRRGERRKRARKKVRVRRVSTCIRDSVIADCIHQDHTVYYVPSELGILCPKEATTDELLSGKVFHT